MNFSSLFTKYSFRLSLAILIAIVVGCDDDDPKKENVPELITKAELTFSPLSGGDDIVVSATDPDGEGVQDLQVTGPINLEANTSYELSIALFNELADPASPEYNISDEVEEEGEEHMFFFQWTVGLFDDPSGNGNIDNRSDAVNYDDLDNSGLPLGLLTTWQTGDAGAGDFRVVLKHQPDLKSETSTASEGDTDMDITFDLNVE